MSGSGGTIASSSTGTAGSLTIVTGATPQTYSGTIANFTGSGNQPVSLTVAGTGTQTLSGPNTYTGATTVSAGELILNPTTITGNIDLASASITGTLDLNWATNSSDSWQLTSPITGAGALIKDGAGWIDTNGAGVFTNFTGSITVNNGTLGNGFLTATWTNSTASLTINSPGLFDLRGNAAATIIGSLSGNGDIVNTNNSNITNLTIGAGNASSTYSGVIHGNATGIAITASGVAYTSANAEGGRTSLTKIGSGTIALNGLNTYSGVTTITAGTLSVSTLAAGGSPSGIGQSTNAAANLVLSGGILSYTGGTVSTDRTFTLTNNAEIDVTTFGHNLTITGSNSGAFTITKGGAGTLTLGGSADNSSLGATVAAGTLILGKASASGVHAIGGGLTINGSGAIGQLSSTVGQLGGDQIYDGTGVTVTNGTFDLNAQSETIGTLNGVNGGVVTNSNNAATSTLTVSGGTVNTGLGGGSFAGVLQNGAGTLALTKGGSATLTLSGANTYTGVTTVNAGMLQEAKEVSLYNDTPASWTATNIVVASGATLAFNVGGTGEFTATDLNTLLALGTASGGFKSGSTVALDTTNAAGANFSYSSAIANPNGGANVLGLTKLGANTLTLSGANTYTGATAINVGTVQFQGSACPAAARSAWARTPRSRFATTAPATAGRSPWETALPLPGATRSPSTWATTAPTPETRSRLVR